MDIVQFMLQECAIPVIISIICFWIQYRITSKAERKNAVPNMYILKLNGKEKTKLNEAKIKKCKHIIEFSYREPLLLDNMQVADRNILFEEITYKELLNRAGKHEVILMGFDNIDMAGLSLKYVTTMQKEFYKIDEKVVPLLLDTDNNCCFVCREEHTPYSIRADFLEHSVQYEIKGRDCVVCPRMKK